MQTHVAQHEDTSLRKCKCTGKGSDRNHEHLELLQERLLAREQVHESDHRSHIAFSCHLHAIGMKLRHSLSMHAHVCRCALIY